MSTVEDISFAESRQCTLARLANTVAHLFKPISAGAGSRFAVAHARRRKPLDPTPIIGSSPVRVHYP